MRSLARAFSSSRRAPPKTASWRPSAMARSRVGVCSRLRVAPGDVSSTVRPASMSSCTRATTRRTPSSAAWRSRNSSTSSKLRPVSTCRTGKGTGAGQKALRGQVQHDDGVLAPREQQRRPLELGRHLPEDVDGLGLEGAQVRQAVVARCPARAAGAAVGPPSGGRSQPPRAVPPTDLPFVFAPANREKFRPRPPPRQSRAPRRAPPASQPRVAAAGPAAGDRDSRRRPRPSEPHPASWRRWRSRRGLR